jgi:hypothetical protein
LVCFVPYGASWQPFGVMITIQGFAASQAVCYCMLAHILKIKSCMQQTLYIAGVSQVAFPWAVDDVQDVEHLLLVELSGTYKCASIRGVIQWCVSRLCIVWQFGCRWLLNR